MKNFRYGGVTAPVVLVALGLAPAAFNRFDPLDTAALPRLLSQTGIYADIAAKVPDSALKPFVLNAALWSDGAAKQRWIILPPGTRVPYVDSSDALDFPHGTVFVKNFLMDSIENDPGSRVPWETRLLIKGVDSSNGFSKWYGFSYRWNAPGTEAFLVDRNAGFDTVFYYRRGGSGGRSYKKWRFPSQFECSVCHREAFGFEPLEQPRGALGFFPVQLKRPDGTNAGVNQVTRLFAQGVFSGSPPSTAQLAGRWKGIDEPIPAGLAEDQRFRVLDTMARSYIGANCSGCHGARGLRHLDFDFFRLRPALEFGTRVSISYYLFPEIVDGSPRFPEEALNYRLALRHAGVDTGTGALWDMTLPAGGIPYLVHAGHVAASSLLYRQWIRNTPAVDSAVAREEDLARAPGQRRPWLFDDPWGSEAWRNRLAQYGLSPQAVMRFEPDPNQMPPLASHLPDTAALRVLAEWVKTYRTLHRLEGEDSVTGFAGRVSPAGRAFVRGRVLFVPSGWEGPARLIGVSGRVYRLTPAGAHRYALPASAAPGVYLFEVGSRRFRASVLH